MTRTVIVSLATLGVIGQVAALLLVVVASLRLVGIGGPLRTVRTLLWGFELWLGFIVAAVATGGSLFFSEVADFVPCELCWFQRIFMYPLAVVLLPLAIAGEHRLARYLLPLPVIGAGFSTHHLLVENGVLEQSRSCSASAPGGCTVKWIEEFGYVTIPVLALTAFVLVFAFLAFASIDMEHPDAHGGAAASGG